MTPTFAHASVHDLESMPFRSFSNLIEGFAHENGLRMFSKGPSKRWEYAWLWHTGLSEIQWDMMKLIDLGSELSPMPWYLACLGAQVTLVEATAGHVPAWEKLRNRLNVKVDWTVTDNETIPAFNADADVVTSFSVIEHQSSKRKAINEVVRVLKPGGIFALSFDVCEPEFGMSFPPSFGRALSLREFEAEIWDRPEFDCPDMPAWNVKDIPDYLQWHRTTGKLHNYGTGAAILVKEGGEPCSSQ